MDYKKELNNLKTAQKNAAVADLQTTRDTSLSNLQAEEAKIKPEYAAQRSTANANNRVAARNFQEYLANTGRANSGIGAQYEMSRQNNLQSGLNSINTAEAQSIADIARRRSDVENAYNTGLASANAQVEANYIQNLLNQAQQQWEREFAQKQFNESVRQYNLNRQDALRKGFSVGGGSSSSSRSTGGKKTSSTGKGVTSSLGSAAANAISSALSGNNTTTNKTNSNDYAIKQVRSPSGFSSKEAQNYYTKNLMGLKTKSQLDNAIAAGLRSGAIDKNDANNIYKMYGIN